MSLEADRIEHAARVACQTSGDFGDHVGETWRYLSPAVQERWRAIAQAVLDYAEPSEEVKRMESQMRGLRSAYEHAAAQRDKYMRRTAEWRSAALDGHKMPEDDDIVRACTGCGKCSYCTARGITAASVLKTRACYHRQCPADACQDRMTARPTDTRTTTQENR
jgi:hypothetical protein